MGFVIPSVYVKENFATPHFNPKILELIRGRLESTGYFCTFTADDRVFLSTRKEFRRSKTGADASLILDFKKLILNKKVPFSLGGNGWTYLQTFEDFNALMRFLKRRGRGERKRARK